MDGILENCFGRVLEEKTIKQILRSHERWLAGKEDGQRANLNGVDLSGKNLSGMDLRGIELQYAILVNTNLKRTNLGHANLQGAILMGADLRGANLSFANLTNVSARSARWNGVVISDAVLTSLTV